MIWGPGGTHVAIVNQLEFYVHARNTRCTHVRPVHQTDAVQGSASEHQTAIHPPDNLALVVRRKAKIIIIFGPVAAFTEGRGPGSFAVRSGKIFADSRVLLLSAVAAKRHDWNLE